METLEAVLFVVLGWLLGLLSPLIVDAVRNRRRKREIAEGVRTELSELRFRCAMTLYGVYEYLGKWDRSFFSWLVEVLRDYHGEHTARRDNLFLAVKEFLKGTDDELSALAAARREEKPGTDIGLRKYQVPYLDAHIDRLSYFSEAEQQKILEIRTQLAMLHELIDQSRDYFRLSFSVLPDDLNRPALESNMATTYNNIGERMRYICELCVGLEKASQVTVYEASAEPAGGAGG